MIITGVYLMANVSGFESGWLQYVAFGMIVAQLFAMVMLMMPPVPWRTDLPARVADAGAAHCTRGRLSTRRRKRLRRQQPCQDWI